MDQNKSQQSQLHQRLTSASIPYPTPQISPDFDLALSKSHLANPQPCLQINPCFQTQQASLFASSPRQTQSRMNNSTPNSDQYSPEPVKTITSDSSQYVKVSKAKISSLISQLLVLLCELHQAPAAPAFSTIVSHQATNITQEVQNLIKSQPAAAADIKNQDLHPNPNTKPYSTQSLLLRDTTTLKYATTTSNNTAAASCSSKHVLLPSGAPTPTVESPLAASRYQNAIDFSDLQTTPLQHFSHHHQKSTSAAQLLQQQMTSAEGSSRIFKSGSVEFLHEERRHPREQQLHHSESKQCDQQAPPVESTLHLKQLEPSEKKKLGSSSKRQIAFKGIEGLKRLTTLQALPVIEKQVQQRKRRTPAVQKARIRLNQAQKARLELSYLRDPDWSNEEMERLASIIQIPFTKVYKWNWERKKKDEKHVTLYDLAALYPEIIVQDDQDQNEVTESEINEETPKNNEQDH